MFGVDNLIFIKCFVELKKRKVIDGKAHDQKLNADAVNKLEFGKLQKNVVIDGEMMKDIRTDEVLGPEFDYIYGKEKS